MADPTSNRPPTTEELTKQRFIIIDEVGPPYSPNHPLWRVMQDAYFEGRNPGISEPHGYAAELRAIAKYLFEHRQMAAATLLLAEADKAEAGE